MKMRIVSMALAIALAGCGSDYQPDVPKARAAAASGRTKVAIFAGGCFWCTESDFEKVPGIVSAVSGYTGGKTANPTYEQVSAGGTGHLEAVRVEYDPTRVTYAQLLDTFWRNVDPVDARGQFCDKGEQYTGAIIVATPEERALAEASKQRIAARFAARGETVATRILPAGPFYAAEAYHQDYARKNPLKYKFYRTTCGRDARLAEVWGPPTH